MGNPEFLQPMTGVGELGDVFGGTYPALIWKAFMDPAHEDLPMEAFPEPDPEQWPDSEYVDDEGRDDDGDSYVRPSSVVVTTPPAASETVGEPSGDPTVPTVVRVPLEPPGNGNGGNGGGAKDKDDED
jgi:penicillin-binding protein 1A